MVKLSFKTILVAGIGLVFSSLISGYFFSIGATLWELTIEGKPDLGSPFWFISVPLGIIGILLLIYGIYLAKHKPIPQGENITIPIPAPKRTSRLFFSFRRPPIKKLEDRFQFWILVIALAIFGPVAISMGVNFLQFVPFFVTIPMFGSGILFITLSVLLATTELYAIRENRKQIIIKRKTAYLNLTKEFDDALKAVQEATEPKTKARMLDYFQPKLRNLCYNYDWNEVKDKIAEVLKYIPEKFSSEPHVLDYLQYLAMILHRYGENTRNSIKEKWLKELEYMYNDPKYETNSNLLGILQNVHGYSADYMIRLIDDSATRWSDHRFQSLAGNIEFWELKRRDEVAYKTILKYLVGKMNDVERNNGEKAHERLKFLYSVAMR